MPPLSLQAPPASICRSCLKLILQSLIVRPRSFPLVRTIYSATPTARSPPPPLNPPRICKGNSWAAAAATVLSHPQPSWARNLPSVSAGDLIILNERVKDSSLEDAYNMLFSILPPGHRDRVAWERMAVYRALEGTIRKLLERIIHDQGSAPRVPQPLDFILQLQNLGMSVRKHYIFLLSTLLAREAESEVLLAVFEAAVMSRILAETLEETQCEDLEYLFKGDGELLYVVYLYLHDLGAKSPVIFKIDQLIMHCKVPSTHSIRKNVLQRVLSLSPGLCDKLTELAVSFKIRHLLRLKARLVPALKRFIAVNNLAGLRVLYNSAKALTPSPLTETSYACFISAFLGFWRSQGIALQVWEDMISAGITPSANSWNALLRYGQHQDRSALLKIWKKMILVGVVPDVHCWTTRIHAQFRCNLVQEGFESLNLMLDSGIPPTTETINAAIDGLLAHDHIEESSQVIAIAEELGVPANVITYNTLLRGVLKHGATEIMSLLNNMHRRGISPDVYTFTIVLDGMYKSPPPITHEDVMQIFTYMESLDVHANITTYTALIGGLLEARNFTAVKGVRDMMRQKRIPGNADFYTVLIKAAFQRDDLAEVDALWAEIADRNLRRDHILWMELIWGYAQAGLTQKMSHALEMMKREPGPRIIITLKGYVTILRALERRGERMTARRIVEDVVAAWDERGEFRKEGGAGRIEEEFWEVVGKVGGKGWMLMLRGGVYLGAQSAVGWSRDRGAP